ncbi:DUF4845 domain-containing protein [Pseudomaricurvus alcaniphilus]|uniref:DUF4845 domain-containing protein n=1 Tax=Pseudomaricurvus alcaniphilus TaxID=1166482 RepID=UPI003132B007
MPLARTQTGQSKLGLLILLAVIGFFLLCAFRLIPAYTEDRYIQSALSSLGDEGALVNELSDNEIRRKISNFFMINNVRSQTAKDLQIERLKDRVLVSLDYEVRVPLLYNIDVVMTFNNTWDSSRPDECCKPASE